MRSVTTTDKGTTTSETRARSGLIQIMSASVPTTFRIELRIWLSPCCRVVLTLSMSLVTRLSTSPCEWLSKYFSGSRDSFASTSRRMPYTVRCATPAIR